MSRVLFGADSVYERLRCHVADAYERWGLERMPLGWRWAAG
jgi:hypothetical protein